MLKTALASAALMLAVTTSVGAAPIDYLFSGQVSASVIGGMTYSGSGELIGFADTTTVIVNSPGSRSNILSSLNIIIPGIFTATVSGPTYIFSADNALGFGSGTPASGRDIVESFPPNLSNYDLTTNLGPLSVVNFGTTGPLLTNAGRINLQIGAPTLVATVPEPAAFSLLATGLVAVTALRWRQAAARSGLKLV